MLLQSFLIPALRWHIFTGRFFGDFTVLSGIINVNCAYINKRADNFCGYNFFRLIRYNSQINTLENMSAKTTTSSKLIRLCWYYDLWPAAPPTLSADPTFYARNGAGNTMLFVRVTNAKPQVVQSQITWLYTDDDSLSSLIDIGLPRYTSILNAGNLQLVIQDPIITDSGVYSVRVHHTADNVSLDLTLNVLGKCVYSHRSTV